MGQFGTLLSFTTPYIMSMDSFISLLPNINREYTWYYQMEFFKLRGNVTEFRGMGDNPAE